MWHHRTSLLDRARHSPVQPHLQPHREILQSRFVHRDIRFPGDTSRDTVFREEKGIVCGRYVSYCNLDRMSNTCRIITSTYRLHHILICSTTISLHWVTLGLYTHSCYLTNQIITTQIKALGTHTTLFITPLNTILGTVL